MVLNSLPYSRKYWQELNLAVEPQIAITRILADLNQTAKFNSPPKFPAIRYNDIKVLGWVIPYSRKIWRGIKFGGLAVYYYNRQIKIRQNFLLAYICMAIPYRTAKFKSANILSIAILGSTAKFNARQYFRLYGRY